MSINTSGDIPCCGSVHYFASATPVWSPCGCGEREAALVGDKWHVRAMTNSAVADEAAVVAAREPGQVGAQARAELAAIAALTLPGPGGLTELAAEFGFDSLWSERCTGSRAGSRASVLGAWRGGQRKQITVTDEWLCRTSDARREACRMLAAEFDIPVATPEQLSAIRERLHMPALPPRTECVSWDGSIWQRPAHAGEPWSRLSTGRVVVEPDAGPPLPPDRPDGFAQSQVDAAKAVLLANVPKRGAK